MATRGLQFGEVAHEYDRHRPGYPRDLFTELFDVVGLEHPPRVLEVGAGTGKATVELAALCRSVVAIEPDRRMADVARTVLRASAGLRADVHFELSTFEEAPLALSCFDMVVAADSWHWVDGEVKYQRADELLKPGGWLALLWREDRAVDDVVVEHVVRAHTSLTGNSELAYRIMGRGPAGAYAHLPEELASSRLFGRPVHAERPTRREFDALTFTQLLATVSDYRAMDADARVGLLERIRTVVSDHGDRIAFEGSVRLLAAQSLAERLPVTDADAYPG